MLAASTSLVYEGITVDDGHAAGHHPDLFSLTARNVELRPLSPYFRRMFGRDVVAGVGTATLQQERHEATIRVDNHVSIGGLRLGDPDPDAAGDNPPLELAIALTTDAVDRTELVVQGSTSDSSAHTVVGVFTDNLAAHLDNLAGMPFGVLAELIGKPASSGNTPLSGWPTASPLSVVVSAT